MSSDCPAYSTGALSRDVGEHLRQRNTALYSIGERHSWIQMSAGNRPESADQGNQSRSGSNGIYQKSHRAVSAGESFAHDPRPTTAPTRKPVPIASLTTRCFKLCRRVFIS